MFDPKTIKSAHCIGIGGIHVSAVARLLASRGVTVTGSDAVQSDETDRLIAEGIIVTIGHDAANIPADIDVVIFSDAVPENNAERAEAAQRSIPFVDTHAFLGMLFADARQIVVTGTHGKSTTTAIIGKLLEAVGADPTVVVGTRVPGFEKGNLRIGRTDLLVVEGDEFRSHVLSYRPSVLVLNNIEWDHPDVFPTAESYTNLFKDVIERLSSDAQVIWNANDPGCEAVIGPFISTPAKNTRFTGVGIERGDAQFSVKFIADGRWHVHFKGRDGSNAEIALRIPGEMNARNAAMAAAAVRAFDSNVDASKLIQALADFPGVWRRFEYVGDFNGAPIISDYGHHPTEVRETLLAAKKTFPDRRLVLCFQPHQRARTKGLFKNFLPAIALADVILLTEIYDVPGREEEKDADVSSGHLLQALKQEIPTSADKPAAYAKDIADAEAQLRASIAPNDVVIIMGAGPIDKVARNLVTNP